MTPGDKADVTSTLTDLERKLVDLERELADVAGGSPASVAPRLPDAPAERRDAGLRVEDLRGEIADLVRFRDQLEAAAKELVSEYDRLVARLRSGDAAAGGGTTVTPGIGAGMAAEQAAGMAAEPAPADPAPAPPAPAPGTGLPAAVRAGLPGHERPAAPAPTANDTLSFVGHVIVDAGPFDDIATLQTFEQGLARVPGAEDVYVKSFEGNRALIDVQLSNPVPLVQLLREQLPLPIIPREAGEGRLSVDLAAAETHGT